MPSGLLYKQLAGVFVGVLLAGCVGRIPPKLAEQVSWNLDFPEIRRQPETYSGRVVALGGTATHIDAVEDRYRVIVSEVPLDGSSRPRPAVNQLPRGMFIVWIPRHVAPTALRPGVELTVVGEIRGAATVPEAAGAATLPLLEARHMQVWRPSWWPRFQLGISGDIGI
jgi:starvation-inducible outer membrane lipoprotein